MRDLIEGAAETAAGLAQATSELRSSSVTV